MVAPTAARQEDPLLRPRQVLRPKASISTHHRHRHRSHPHMQGREASAPLQLASQAAKLIYKCQ
jgi:hypothetical protein